MQKQPLHRQQGGFALIAVILVLAALLMLCAPFLLTARNSDQASQQLFSRAEAGVALENALTHSRAMLSDSHFSQDPTPYFDALYEVQVNNEFPEGFLNANDTRGLMWDAEALDVAGLIDLNSAPPQVLAAMFGGVTRLVKPITKKEKEITIASAAGFEPEGYLWLGGELIHYGKIEGNRFTDLQRGLGAKRDMDDNVLPGPRPPSSHGVGAIVLDQRAFAPVEWRLFRGDVRDFDSHERLTEADDYALSAEGLGARNLAFWKRLGSVFGGVGAGQRWQRAARMISEATREETGFVTVDSSRWFNPGSTIQITDGTNTELAVVQAVNGAGTLILDRGLANDYSAYSAEVRVLSRRPVNINTASSEVLEVLLTNLKLLRRNQRVTGSEARALTSLILESRPFEGFEDFMRRIVLPAAGTESLPGDAPVIPDVLAAGEGGFIDVWDAVAIYRNALNANDYQLEYSTMPFCFSSRDVYDLTLRATANASSGVERYSAVRERTELIVPQAELFFAWARQEDYDSSLRLTREAPGWMTGPNSTSRYDRAGSRPPTRMWAHLGTYEGQLYLPGAIGGQSFNDPQNMPSPEHVFADRDPDERGWIQLFPSRIDDSSDPELQDRVLHFDHETRDPEGRFLPDQNISYPSSDPRVQWDSGTGMMRGINFSLWIKPRSHADAVLLDVGNTSAEADRLVLRFEGGDLVLRMLDGGGDHRDTPGFQERAEVRYALAAGNGPGLPIDVWSHIEVDVRGTRPSQMMMLVNGLAHGVRSLGLGRLATQIDETTTALVLDSAEGFPDRGVVRIGNELIEYTRSGNTLQATFQATGVDAGFGGRNARVQWSGGATSVPLNVAATAFNHPEGSPVELYGFAQTLAANITSGQAALPDQLGVFRVATVSALEGGSQQGDAISVNGIMGSFIIGNGIDPAITNATGLILGSAEDPDGGQGGGSGSVMQAFNRGGGYAAVMQARFGETVAGVPIGGWEVIRYSGWDGNTLRIASWGDAVPELAGLQGADPEVGGGRRAFVVRWQVNIGGVDAQQIQEARLYVMPISIPAPGGAQTFVSGTAAVPQFAQITEAGAGELTEWVCYNTYVPAGSQLVRDDPIMIEYARAAVTHSRPNTLVDDPTQGGGGGSSPVPPGGGTAPGVPGGGGAQPSGTVLPSFISTSSTQPTLSSSSSSSGAALSRAIPTSTPQATSGYIWDPILGLAEDVDLPITRNVREVFQHRGVMGTFPHAHAAGTLVLPVFRANNMGVDAGRPGKNDPVFLMGSDFGHIGWPVTIFRGHRPSPLIQVNGWQQVPGQVVAQSSGQSWSQVNVGEDQNVWYFALDRAAPAPVIAGTVDPSGQALITDTRAISRLLRFPSGERPRNISQVVVGGAVTGSGVIPSAVIDEVVFGATDFGQQAPGQDPEAARAGQLVLRLAFYEGDAQATIHARSLRTPLGLLSANHEYLSALDQDAGLLRIGSEIIAYEALDASTGEITISQGGRGLLGTQVGSYGIGTPLSFLDGFRVAALSGSINAGTHMIPVTSTADFPREGTLLIGRELIHYTRLLADRFEMPAGSTEPGAMDGLGAGIFRGRYGTIPQAHNAGDPVIFFPMRYWDRWAERADAPELSYFNFQLSQPAAFWREFFFEDEQPGLNGVSLGVLMRTDPNIPWDADPNLDGSDGLSVHYAGEKSGSLPIGVQSDRVEWRVFVDYSQGAFDLDFGLAHGWRATPRLRALAASYVAPSRTLRSVER